ncbi:MAG: hypothetical protein ACOCZS_02610 [Verrucomicrobiota bacterium]
MSESSYQRLHEYFNRLLSLNPYREDVNHADMLAAASDLSAEYFDEFRQRFEELLDTFLGAQWKKNEQAVISKFISHIEHADHQLREKVEKEKENRGGEHGYGEAESANSASSVALVSCRHFRSADWLRALNKGDVPQPLLRAVDAAIQRNRLLPSILRPAFGALHAIDSDAAFEWELAYLENKSGQLDPDVLRALLQNWRQQKAGVEPHEAVEWALRWSTNANLRRQWPAVVEEADIWLRDLTARRWLIRQSERSETIVFLQRLFRRQSVQEQDYWRWIEAAIADLGIEIRRFTSLSAAASRHHDPEEKEKIQRALLHRLKSMNRLFIALIIVSDLLPRMPDGAYRLALALFGISHTHLQTWRQRLQENAFSIIQKIFLDNLKNQETPLETIKKFTFGDHQLYQHLANHLDIVSKNFTSMEDRDAVTETLAVNYASFRENELLDKNISRRYRHLMAALHEDNLHRLFNESQYREISSLQTLFDAFSLAASARHFLKIYRSLDTSVAALLGAEEDFLYEVKKLRTRLIGRLFSVSR